MHPLKSIKKMTSALFSYGKPVDLIMFHDFRPPPYGGGNQFMTALRNELVARGFRIAENTTKPSAKACIFNSFNFDFDKLRRMRDSGMRMVHRVDGPVMTYRGFDDGTDEKVAKINGELADVTVFQSRYSLEQTVKLGFNFNNPVIIANAADPKIFHSKGRISFSRRRKIKLISTSWSGNPNKGGQIYKWLDENLDRDRYQYSFYGRASEDFDWLQTYPPVPSEELAAALRDHDIYITASRNDPCSNSLIEALSSGLPVIYMNSGGHPELAGQAGFGFENQTEIPALLDQLVNEYEQRQRLIKAPDLSSIVDSYQGIMGLGGEKDPAPCKRT